jgi:hypothetical protein
MGLFSTLKRLIQHDGQNRRLSRRAAPRPPSFRPRIDTLEQRFLPSGLHGGIGHLAVHAAGAHVRHADAPLAVVYYSHQSRADRDHDHDQGDRHDRGDQQDRIDSQGPGTQPEAAVSRAVVRTAARSSGKDRDHDHDKNDSLDRTDSQDQGNGQNHDDSQDPGNSSDNSPGHP